MARNRYYEDAYALLIGVGNDDIPQSKHDAEGIGRVLMDPDKAAYNPKKTRILTADETTREGMLEAMGKLVDTVGSQKDATVILYYSGHGGVFPTAENGSQYFFCNHGFREDEPETTGISADEFTLLVQSIPSKRKLVLLDCCHAGGMITDNGEMVQHKFLSRLLGLSTYRGLVEKLGMGEGVVSVVSCDKDEKSVIFQNAQYSLFTEKVIEALEGYGSGQDDYVAVIDLINYVLKTVPRAYSRQNPKLKTARELDGRFSLCRNSFPIGISDTPERSTGGLKSLQSQHEVDLQTSEPNIEYVYHVKGQIHDSVKLNKLERAFLLFDGLLTIIDSKILRDTVVLLNRNYRSLQDDQMMGVITAERYNTEMAKISLRMLNCADRLEEFYENGF